MLGCSDVCHILVAFGSRIETASVYIDHELGPLVLLLWVAIAGPSPFYQHRGFAADLFTTRFRVRSPGTA